MTPAEIARDIMDRKSAGVDYTDSEDVRTLATAYLRLDRLSLERQQWRSRMGLTPSSDALLIRAERAEKNLEGVRQSLTRIASFVPPKDPCLHYLELVDVARQALAHLTKEETR